MAASLPLAASLELNVNSADSISDAASTLAYGLMNYYTNNQSSTPPSVVGTLPQPLYWWEAAAVWGGLIDFWAYTNDSRYNPTIQQALMAQTGPDYNYMPEEYFYTLGNDDQTFWAMACLTALEYDFPVPEGERSSVYLDLAVNVFNTQVPRWDTTTCGGGLKWQVFENRNGYHYKNSVSNGGFIQMAARLARYTGNQTYLDWAEQSWDWMRDIGLIGANYGVFDGSDDTLNCTELDHTTWSYNPAMLIYSTAILYNYTNGSDSEMWQERTTGLLTAAANRFFSPYENATDVMWEPACEPTNNCNNDQYAFKGLLARWMAKAAVVAPYIAEAVEMLLATSAEAAAESCSGGTDDVTCGQKWYVGGYDGSYGVGQQLSALETVQSLLLLHGDVNFTRQYPATEDDVYVRVESSPTTTLRLPPGGEATNAPDSDDNDGGDGNSDDGSGGDSTQGQDGRTDSGSSSEDDGEDGDNEEGSGSGASTLHLSMWNLGALPVLAGLFLFGIAK